MENEKAEVKDKFRLIDLQHSVFIDLKHFMLVRVMVGTLDTSWRTPPIDKVNIDLRIEPGTLEPQDRKGTRCTISWFNHLKMKMLTFSLM